MASHTCPGEHLGLYRPWWLHVGTRWIRAWPLSFRPAAHRRFLARLAGLESRDRARSLVGSRVGVPRERLPASGAGSYYWCDLVGLAAHDERSGARLGRVSGLLDNGAHEILELEGGRLVPFVPGVHVGEVDLEGGSIHLRCLGKDWD